MSFNMSKLSLVCVFVVIALGVRAQLPTPCMTPMQLTFRGIEINHRFDEVRRFFISYDATNKRKVMFEEERSVTPGKQFHEYLVLNNENIEYDLNLKTKVCTKSIPRRWFNYGIPANATFENEYYIGGPDEEVFVEEWSDRIPLRRRELWLGSFSVKNCYPIHNLLIGPEFAPNDTITARFYDIVDGIPNPNDFIPPKECLTAAWAKSTRPIAF